MQLMKGFAQTAKDEEVQKYFTKGYEISKEIIKVTENILIENGIQPPATSGATVTNATMAPFSDKLMLFCTYLLCGFSLGSQGFTASFNLRFDVIAKTTIFAKDIYEFTMEGIRIMMSKGWLEEPPKMDL